MGKVQAMSGHDGEYYIGLMSGTSLDGVDAVLASFTEGFKIVNRLQVDMPAGLRTKLLQLQQTGYDEIDLAMVASNQLAELYATAVNNLLSQVPPVSSSQVAAIGCHGQTIRHQPLATSPYSVQINNPARLAELTGIAVAADFRSRDIAAGGQGAPLTAAFHAHLFRHSHKQRYILNLGGMTNLSILPPGNGSASVLGFDCGPGVVLLDAWSDRHLQKAYDENGQWADSGQCDDRLLHDLMAHPFLAQQPPKSCGRQDFNLDWLEDNIAQQESAARLIKRPQDVQATLVAFSAESVARAIHNFASEDNSAGAKLYACGGGAKNIALLQALETALPDIEVATTGDLGLPVDAVEAAAFAWLAYRLLQGEASNLPLVTGARGERVLGALYPA